jgi:hypothetical protein
VAHRLQRKYPHLVRLIYSGKNRGMTGNFRLITRLCRGEYIAGCEGDDFWTDDRKLERQVEALDRLASVDMAFTRGYRLYPDGTRIPGWDYGPTARVIPQEEMFRGLGFIAPAASSVMRSAVLQGLPEWVDEAPVGDVFHYLAGSARGGAYYDPAYTICYRMAHAASFSVAHEERSDAERIAFFKASIHYMERTCRHYRIPRQVVAERLDEYQLQIAIHSFKLRKPLVALRELTQVGPVFLARGVGRRLVKLLGRKNS